jgi:nicotinate phosphoribosyltransferase
MNINPIITSMLDDDLYKFTMGAVVFHNFPTVDVTYKFFNRAKTQFPVGFAIELKKQIQSLSNLVLSDKEEIYMRSQPFNKTYVEWLKNYTYDPSEVYIDQHGGDLTIEINGLWYRTIYWEVKLMAIISELYFIMTEQNLGDNWHANIVNTADKLSKNGCNWSDFGTRRRYSNFIQDQVVKHQRLYAGFKGTSNPHFAMKYDVPVKGTYAHESIMAMQGLYGVEVANTTWMKVWSEYYRGLFGIALTDTFTTDVFLRSFNNYYARLFDGVRHDSSDPFEWGEKMIAHYNKLGIPTRDKTFVFSDGLNADKYIEIHNHFKKEVKPFGGIGTFLTNNVGLTPLNMVIKMTYIIDNNRKKYVVKLSDSSGKHTGNLHTIDNIKEELNIV